MRASAHWMEGVGIIDVPVEERSLHASLAANARWSRAGSEERKAQGRTAHAGLIAKLTREIDPDGVLPPEELAARLKNAKSAHYQRMALRKHVLERKRKEKASKAAGAPAATGAPASENPSESHMTGQEPQ